MKAKILGARDLETTNVREYLLATQLFAHAFPNFNMEFANKNEVKKSQEAFLRAGPVPNPQNTVSPCRKLVATCSKWVSHKRESRLMP